MECIPAISPRKRELGEGQRLTRWIWITEGRQRWQTTQQQIYTDGYRSADIRNHVHNDKLMNLFASLGILDKIILKLVVNILSQGRFMGRHAVVIV